MDLTIVLIIVAIGLGVGAVLYFKKKKENPVDKPTSKDVADWEIGPWLDGKTSSATMPRHPQKSSSSGVWEFFFPKQAGPVHEGPGVHYVYRRVKSGELSIGKTLTATVVLEGSGFLDASDGGGLPSFWLWFQRKDDNWTAKDDYAYYRWWSKTGIRLRSNDGSPLTGQTLTVTAPLTLESWGPVMTIDDPIARKEALFGQAMKNAQYVGITFGGGGGKGHGVYLKTADGASMKCTLKSFTVT